MVKKFRCDDCGRVHWYLPAGGCRDCRGELKPLTPKRRRKDARSKPEKR